MSGPGNRFGIPPENTETTLGLLLLMLGEHGRGLLRERLLAMAGQGGKEARTALNVMSTYERAFDEIARRKDVG